MNRDDKIACLNRDPWFASLRPEMADLLVDLAIERTYGAGQIVYTMDDVSTGMFCVITGGVRLSQLTPGGKHLLFGAMHSGMWFGVISEFDGLPRPYTAIAVEPSVLLRLPSAVIADIMSRHWRNAFDFGRCVVVLYRRTLALLSNHRTLDYAARTAQTLLAMSDYAIAEHKDGNEPRVTQEDLAAMVGVTRQTIYRLLAEWEAQGLIERGYGRVRLLDPVRLTSIAIATE